MVKGLFWAGKLMLKPAHRVALSCSLLPIWLLINSGVRCLSEKPLEAARQASSTESVSEGGRPSLGAKFFPPIISLPPSPPAEVAGLAVSTSYPAPVANEFHSARGSWWTVAERCGCLLARLPALRCHRSCAWPCIPLVSNGDPPLCLDGRRLLFASNWLPLVARGMQPLHHPSNLSDVHPQCNRNLALAIDSSRSERFYPRT
jgi:hypothetical protein